MLGSKPVGVVGGPGQVVEQDRAADADLVTQQGRVGSLDLEGGVVADVLARVGFPGVHEVPGHLGVAIGRVVEQRTLC